MFHVCVCADMCMPMYVHICTCGVQKVYVSVCVCVCVQMYMHMCVCGHVYTYMCVYIYEYRDQRAMVVPLRSFPTLLFETETLTDTGPHWLL